MTTTVRELKVSLGWPHPAPRADSVAGLGGLPGKECPNPAGRLGPKKRYRPHPAATLAQLPSRAKAEGPPRAGRPPRLATSDAPTRAAVRGYSTVEPGPAAARPGQEL